jgi:hypothetical protein
LKGRLYLYAEFPRAGAECILQEHTEKAAFLYRAPRITRIACKCRASWKPEGRLHSYAEFPGAGAACISRNTFEGGCIHMQNLAAQRLHIYAGTH